MFKLIYWIVFVFITIGIVFLPQFGWFWVLYCLFFIPFHKKLSF